MAPHVAASRHAQIKLLDAASWHGIDDARREIKEAANRGGLTSGRGRLNVRREWYQIERRARSVNFRFNISRLIHQSGGHFGVLGCLGDPKQNRRLTHEVLFAYHCRSLGIPAPHIPSRSRAFVPGPMVQKCTWRFLGTTRNLGQKSRNRNRVVLLRGNNDDDIAEPCNARYFANRLDAMLHWTERQRIPGDRAPMGKPRSAADTPAMSSLLVGCCAAEMSLIDQYSRASGINDKRVRYSFKNQ